MARSLSTDKNLLSTIILVCFLSDTCMTKPVYSAQPKSTLFIGHFQNNHSHYLYWWLKKKHSRINKHNIQSNSWQHFFSDQGRTLESGTLFFKRGKKCQHTLYLHPCTWPCTVPKPFVLAPPQSQAVGIAAAEMRDKLRGSPPATKSLMLEFWCDYSGSTRMLLQEETSRG